MHTPPHSHPGPPSAISLTEAQLFSGLKQAEKERKLLSPTAGLASSPRPPPGLPPLLERSMSVKSLSCRVRPSWSGPGLLPRGLLQPPELSFLPGTYKMRPAPTSTVLRRSDVYRVGSLPWRSPVFVMSSLSCEVKGHAVVSTAWALVHCPT